MKYIQHSIYFLIYNSFGVNQQSSSSNEYGKERCLHICTLGMNNPWPVSFLVQPAFAFIHAKRSKQILHSMTMASGLQLCMDLQVVYCNETSTSGPWLQQSLSPSPVSLPLFHCHLELCGIFYPTICKLGTVCFKISFPLPDLPQRKRTLRNVVCQCRRCWNRVNSHKQQDIINGVSQLSGFGAKCQMWPLTTTAQHQCSVKSRVHVTVSSA